MKMKGDVRRVGGGRDQRAERRWRERREDEREQLALIKHCAERFLDEPRVTGKSL